MKIPFRPALALLACALAWHPALSEKVDETKDVRALEKQLNALVEAQKESARQIDELRKALEALKASPAPPATGPAAASGTTGPVETKGLTPYPLFGSTDRVTSGTSFNPAISVIPEFFYYHDDRGGRGNTLPFEAAGFAGTPRGEGRDLPRGFSLGETELAISASADPYFDATAIFSFAPDGVSVEEAYLRTRRLPFGLSLKAGQFYSGIGYANEQHSHQWDFYDQNLPYQLLLGGGINQAGVQLTWLPRTPVYLLFGVEALQGTNEGIANVAVDPGGALSLPDRAGPRLFTGFFRISPDVGYSDALQLGGWLAYSSQHQEIGDLAGPVAWDGTAWAAGADAVFKHDAGHFGGRGNFTLRAEYIYRKKDLSAVSTGGETPAGTPRVDQQDGLNVEATWGLASRWTLNARFDAVGLTNDVTTAGLRESFRSSSRLSAALVFNPTEFSRIRAQYERGDLALPGGDRETYNQFALQVQLSLGVHGAHKF
jgi:hypothetical protein